MNLLKLIPFALLALMACQPKSTSEVIDPVDPPGTSTPTPVGKPIGLPSTKIIGPAGGTLVTPDGKLSLTFPVGAVTKETAITVQPVENTAPNGVGIGYHISPDNLTFEQPITFDYSYQDKELIGSAIDAMGLAVQADDKTWKLAEPVTVSKPQKKVTARVKKARWWALVTQYRLLPEKDTVLVTESRDIKLMHLRAGNWPDWTKKPTPKPGDSPDDLLAPLVDPEEMANRAIVGLDLNGVSWSGVPPQDQTWGSVSWSQTDSRILYVAPGKKPATKNPVVISVEIMNPTSSAKLMLAGEVYIKGDKSFTLDGRNFTSQFVVSAAAAGGNLYVNVHGVDSTGKNAVLTVLLKNPTVGSSPFTADDDVFVGVLNEAAKETQEQGASVYKKCRETVPENGAVHILQYEQSKGYLKLSCRVTGSLVTIHEEDEKCGVIRHLTTKVYCEFTTVVRQ